MASVIFDNECGYKDLPEGKAYRLVLTVEEPDARLGMAEIYVHWLGMHKAGGNK